MKKYLIILLILCVFAFSACSNNSGENSSNSIEDLPQPTSPSFSLSIEENNSTSEEKIVISEHFQYTRGKITIEDGILFVASNNKFNLPVLEDKCQIYLMVLVNQGEVSQDYVKQEADSSILTNELSVDVKVKTLVTTINHNITNIEFLEIIEICVYPPDRF
ncbi:MAG: hypothetical protein IJF75_04180 [Clostridia bacterium]|nr:hypothetical protein [Clostridia bacterium]